MKTLEQISLTSVKDNFFNEISYNYASKNQWQNTLNANQRVVYTHYLLRLKKKLSLCKV